MLEVSDATATDESDAHCYAMKYDDNAHSLGSPSSIIETTANIHDSFSTSSSLGPSSRVCIASPSMTEMATISEPIAHPVSTLNETPGGSDPVERYRGIMLNNASELFRLDAANSPAAQRACDRALASPGVFRSPTAHVTSGFSSCSSLSQTSSLWHPSVDQRHADSANASLMTDEVDCGNSEIYSEDEYTTNSYARHVRKAFAIERWNRAVQTPIGSDRCPSRDSFRSHPPYMPNGGSVISDSDGYFSHARPSLLPLPLSVNTDFDHNPNRATTSTNGSPNDVDSPCGSDGLSSLLTRYDVEPSSRIHLARANKQRSQYNCKPEVNGHSRVSSSRNYVDVQNVLVMDWLKNEAVLFKLSVLMRRSPDQKLKNWRKNVEMVQNVWKFIKSVKSKNQVTAPEPVSTRSELYGRPLSSIQACTSNGCPLPRFVRDIMDYIRRNAEDAEGVFRRNGARQRIERIRNACNSLGPEDPIPLELLRESEFTDLADALKMYFRELPEPIMTDRLSEMLIEAGNALPEDQRFLVAHYCTLLLPSENRQALLMLLAFLREVSEYSPTNKMSADNLATCLMPSLCRLSPAFGPVTGLKRRKTISMPSEKDRTEYNLMKSFLSMMITDWRKLLVLPSDLARELDSSQLDVHTEMKLPLKDGRFDLRPEYQRQLTHLHDELVQEYRHGWDGWQLMRFFSDGTQLYVKDADDELPIRLFRVQVMIPAPVSLVHAAILRNRKSWDMNVLGCKKIAPTGQSYDVIKVTYGDAVSGTEKYAYLARRWTYGKVTGDNVCTIVERSVSPFASSRFESKPRVNVLKSSFIIVPDAGYSQLNYVSRMDVGGKTSLWYERVYGTMLAEQMRRFRNQFLNTRLTANGRETVI